MTSTSSPLASIDPLSEPEDRFSTNLPLCYEILLYLASRCAKLAAGDVLEFVTSDPEAEEKVPSWCEARDYTLLQTEALSDGRHRFLIRK